MKLKTIHVITVFVASLSTAISNGQVSVSIDEDASWIGYMHRFENVNGTKGNWIAGNSFAVTDLIALISNDSSQSITLKPNTNLYNASDPYWSNGAGDGNKWMEAITYVEYGSESYPGGALTFFGNIASFTLDTRYTLKAFIKEFTSGYQLVNIATQDIVADTTDFSFSYTPTNDNNVIQYGFVMEGLNANPQTDWGQVTITTANNTNSSYQLVWSDEFNDDGSAYISGNANPVDDTKWFQQTILPEGYPNGWSWYNNELQHYTNEIENSYVSNGTLKIVAKAENYTDQGHTKEFTSARLNSKYAFTYGMVEVRAKLPTGAGTWPAIWMLGKNISEPGAYWQQQGFGTTGWPNCGEIDIMEHWGKNQNYVSSAMHTPSSYGGTINHGGQTISTASTEFHTYTLVWTDEKMVFSVDGVSHYTYNPTVKNDDTWPFYKDQFLLLNVAIENGTNSNTFVDTTMEIDYVRVYQLQPLDTPSVSKDRLFNIWFNNKDKNIHISSPDEIQEIALYNLVGQEVFYQQQLNRKDIRIKPDVPKGLYVLKASSMNERWIQKIIVN